MTMSAGIMTRLAFSMPPLTPSATTMKVAAMKIAMNTKLDTGLVMNPAKYPSPVTADGSAI